MSGSRVWALRALLGCALAACAGPADAQVAPRSSDPLRPGPALPLADLTQDGDPLHRLPGLALAASALLPGTGQLMLGAERWVPYAVVEAWAWVSYLDRRGEARSRERLYKDLAWSVARRISTGVRRDTVFDYYEAMAHFAASGAFDADPRQPGIQPETDPTTFNGDKWLLARSLFIPSGGFYPPGTIEYQRALDYYVRNAIPGSFAWAWGDSELEQQVFNELIRASDAAQRTATRLLGVIVANHVVSAIDALVLARLQARAGLQLRLGSGLDADASGLRWKAAVRVHW